MATSKHGVQHAGPLAMAVVYGAALAVGVGFWCGVGLLAVAVVR